MKKLFTANKYVPVAVGSNRVYRCRHGSGIRAVLRDLGCEYFDQEYSTIRA